MFPGKTDFISLSTLPIPLYFRHNSKVLSSFLSFHPEEQVSSERPPSSAALYVPLAPGQSEETILGKEAEKTLALSLLCFSQDQEPKELPRHIQQQVRDPLSLFIVDRLV